MGPILRRVSDQPAGQDSAIQNHDREGVIDPSALPDVAGRPLLELLYGKDPQIRRELERLTALVSRSDGTTSGWQSFLDTE